MTRLSWVILRVDYSVGKLWSRALLAVCWDNHYRSSSSTQEHNSKDRQRDQDNQCNADGHDDCKLQGQATTGATVGVARRAWSAIEILALIVHVNSLLLSYDYCLALGNNIGELNNDLC